MSADDAGRRASSRKVRSPHGGEFIDTRHVHILGLAKELGLKVDDLFSGYQGSWEPIWVDGGYLKPKQVHTEMERVRKAVTKLARRIGVFGKNGNGKPSTKALSYGTATPGAVKLDQPSMTQWLEENVRGFTASVAGRWFNDRVRVVRAGPRRSLGGEPRRLLADPLSRRR